MPPRKTPEVPKKALPVVHPDAAGIDVHSDMHMVAVPADRDSQPVRRFGAYTADLQALADWLKQCAITTVAMESTGVYWIPLFELLESQGFEVFLVEPGQLSHCGARPKTDVLDAQWIQRLHACGLLRGSFRPPDSVLALRGYHRQRQMLVRYAAGHVQHMQKALEQMNVKLTEVVCDITGTTGTAIIEAIIKGHRDAKKLAALRHPKCKTAEEELARALEGTWRPEHVFALRQAFELYQFYHTQITVCDQQIRDELAKVPARSGGKAEPKKARARGRKSNDVRFEAAVPLFRALGVNLTAIDGIDVGTALVIAAEIGADVSRFASEKQFASWLGLCPRQHESNKTKSPRGPRRGKNRVAQALRMCAQSVGRTQTALGSFYRRIRGRTGGKCAITATAHKLARLVYRLLKHGAEYVRVGLAEYEQKVKSQSERWLRQKAGLLGYELVSRGGAVPAPSERVSGRPCVVRQSHPADHNAEREVPPGVTPGEGGGVGCCERRGRRRTRCSGDRLFTVHGEACRRDSQGADGSNSPRSAYQRATRNTSSTSRVMWRADDPNPCSICGGYNSTSADSAVGSKSRRWKYPPNVPATQYAPAPPNTSNRSENSSIIWKAASSLAHRNRIGYSRPSKRRIAASIGAHAAAVFSGSRRRPSGWYDHVSSTRACIRASVA
jgi:transposase